MIAPDLTGVARIQRVSDRLGDVATLSRNCFDFAIGVVFVVDVRVLFGLCVGRIGMLL